MSEIKQLKTFDYNGNVYNSFVDQLAQSNIGDLASLNTTEKTNLVAAINEVLANGGGTGGIVSGESDVLVVTGDADEEGNFVVSHTVSEIKTAAMAGKAIFGKFPSTSDGLSGDMSGAVFVFNGIITASETVEFAIFNSVFTDGDIIKTVIILTAESKAAEPITFNYEPSIITTIDEEAKTSNLSASAIYTAYNNGKNVMALLDGALCPLISMAGTSDAPQPIFHIVNLGTDGKIYNGIIEVSEKTAVVTITNYTAPIDKITATVGQIAKVKSVDENGRPAEWEAVDMPSGVASSTIDLEPVEDENGTGVQITVNTTAEDGAVSQETYTVYNGKDGTGGPGESNVLVVTIDEATSTASHSMSEIHNAVAEGKFVVLTVEGMVATPSTTRSTGDYVLFTFNEMNTENWTPPSLIQYDIYVDNEKNITVQALESPIMPIYTEEDYGKVLTCTAEGVVWAENETLPDGEEMTF